MPVRMLRAWYHTLGFIRKGVKSLLSGKLDVPVLDATAITAAMLQNDLGTAGSIMLLLGNWRYPGRVDLKKIRS